MPAWIGRWKNAINGKQLDSVRKETHVVSVMIEHLETDAIRGKKNNRPLVHQKRRHRLTERDHQKVQESGCTYGDKCRFRHVEADGQPSKKSKKRGVKGSVATSKGSVQLCCLSQDSHPRKLGSNHTVQFSKGTWHTTQKLGKERVHREASFKSVNLTSAIRAPPSLS